MGEVAAYAVLCTVYTLITLFLLRKSKCGKIIERYGFYREK